MSEKKEKVITTNSVLIGMVERLEKRLAEIEAMLDKPRSRTPHETDNPHTCPDCKGNGIVKDGYSALFECARCKGSGQV